jgi:hypothetical protein
MIAPPADVDDAEKLEERRAVPVEVAAKAIRIARRRCRGGSCGRRRRR